jgi:hypothetical protein
MQEYLGRVHVRDRRQDEKAADEHQRHAVGDSHGEKIARGSECHHRRKERPSDSVGDHEHGAELLRVIGKV